MINQLKFQEFFEKIEAAISSVIMEINQDNLYNWNEDYITFNILKELRRNFRQITIKYSQNRFIQVKANFLKFNRKLGAEEKYGDIAILINLSYDDAKIIQGVGLIEAKKIDKDKNTFLAVKTEQLDTIYKNAPHSYLMLYDYQRIDDNKIFKDYLQIKKSQFPTPLYATLVPVNLARRFNEFNPTLYRFSTAFSYQFAYRYMHGLDLEFSDDIIKAAKGYQVNEKYPPQYIIQIAVKHTKYEEQNNLILPEVNSNNFIEIIDNVS